MGNVEILAVPCAKTMAHNDKTNAAPFVILPCVLLSLCVALNCTLAMRSRRVGSAQVTAIETKARRRTVDLSARSEAGVDADR
jgi:hypothetical protein